MQVASLEKGTMPSNIYLSTEAQQEESVQMQEMAINGE
jgi:hypothetical protein